MVRSSCFLYFSIILLFLAVLLVTPCVQAAQSVFEFSEDLLLSLEKEQVSKDSAIQASVNPDTSVSSAQIDMTTPMGTGSLMMNNFTGNSGYTYSPRGDQDEKGEKGEIVGYYSLFLPNLGLILYSKDNPEQSVFGLEALDEQMLTGGTHNQFTIEAQSKLWKMLTISYGYDATHNQSLKDKTLFADSRFVAQNAGLKLNLLPGMSLNADYKKPLVGADKAHRTLNLAYHSGSFASFSAGYGVVLSTNEKGEAAGSSKATFGLRIADSSKELNATYQMESQKNVGTTHSAGLELGLVDLAHLSAVYSKTEDQKLSTAALKSTVDLGLNLNFAANSALCFQYKIVLPDYEPDEEQMAEAKLEIRF